MEQYLEFLINHYLLTLAFIVVTYLLLRDLIENSFSKFEALSPLLAVTKMNSHQVFILDVRETGEYVKGHIEEAKNIPLGNLEEQIETLAPYKNKDVLVVCQSGTRTAAACKILIKAEFEKLLTLQGGMQSWEDNKLPVKTSNKNK
ncbi:MAG: rhodanese-like domain-containing protein [Methylococcaceae bacterium]|nr:rhodanese-like domain-containing protein [Methylococcaceae bacterium]